MEIRKEPLLGAAAFGIVVTVVYSLVDVLAGISQSTPNYTAFGMVGSCIITTIAGLGSGFLYTVLHKREESLTPGGGAKGGAAAGALAHLISSIFTVIVAITVVPRIAAAGMAAQGLSPELAEEAMGFMLAGGAMASAGIACASIFIGALLGAAGGAVGASLGNS